MSEEELGFDPTIVTANGQRFIEIEREGTTERLILDGLMKRARCIAGRATTCWKAHREENPHALFVVKGIYALRKLAVVFRMVLMWPGPLFAL